jgi:hypothetical protein
MKIRDMSIEEASGGRKLFLLDYEANKIITINWGVHNIVGSYSGGLATTAYIKSGSLSATAEFDTIETTSTVDFENGAGTDLTVLDANAVTTSAIVVKGIHAGTEVRAFKVSDNTPYLFASGDNGIESSTGTTATMNYEYASAEDIYLMIHHTDYVTSPSVVEVTTQSISAVVQVFQSIDRVYNNED